MGNNRKTSAFHILFQFALIFFPDTNDQFNQAFSCEISE